MVSKAFPEIPTCEQRSNEVKEKGTWVPQRKRNPGERAEGGGPDAVRGLGVP